MELTVLKNGAVMFDTLHALGLAVTVATATQQPVCLVDTGSRYRLTTSAEAVPADLGLSTLLPLPSAAELQELAKLPELIPLPLAVLDGLLAATFTVPGKRLVSLADLLWQQSQRAETMPGVLRKLQNIFEQWENHVCNTEGWLHTALTDYHPGRPAAPVTCVKRDGDLTLWMPLDPAFGLSACRPLSDGKIAIKNNLTISGTQFAVFLAAVGASRFLRAQRTADRMVNFYVPAPLDVVINPDSALPPLRGYDLAADAAALAHWLALPPLPGQWAGLAYQTLQTQGASQSISVGRGWLDWPWLVNLAARAGGQLPLYWRRLLLARPAERPVELDPLLAMLTAHSPAAWQAHLLETSRRQFEATGQLKLYTLDEVKEVTTTLNTSDNLPLYEILRQENATLRFGHALRQLGQVNESGLRDMLDELEVVQTTDQLLQTLGQAVQHCVVASAKSKFVIIPNDDDLARLLADAELHTPATVARLLVVLSALQYPRVNHQSASSYKPREVAGRQKTRLPLRYSVRPSRPLRHHQRKY